MKHLTAILLCALLSGCFAQMGPESETGGGPGEAEALDEVEQALSATVCIGTQPSIFGCFRSFHTDTSHDHRFPWTGCPAAHRDALGVVYVEAVLGKDTDVARYKGCPGYATLEVNDWSRDLNRQWMYCAATSFIGDDPGINTGTTNLPQFVEVSGTFSGIYAEEDCYLKRSKRNNPPGVGARNVGGGQWLAWQN